MLDWMRSVEIIPSIPGIKSGLLELCDFMVGELNPRTIMYELGSFAGESAEIFARYFERVHCVDPWQEYCGSPSLEDVVNSFDQRMIAAGNIVKHKMGSREMVGQIADASLDFVYIDALHTYEGCLDDILHWFPKVRSGGFIGGHDYEIPELHALDTFPGVEKAVRECFGKVPDRIFPDTSWLVRKP